MWDCQLRKALASDSEMQSFFDGIHLLEPMDPRDAFYGGRTNAIKLYEKIAYDENGQPLERIDYTDICSLYPFICKYGEYPKGHPKIITENFADLKDRPYSGLIKCKILPPNYLYHPVLPFRANQKLLFPLCAACGKNQNTKSCNHSNDERALIGSWVLLEVYEAIKKGYEVLEIFEIWNYTEMEQYNQDSNPDGGLFTGYINAFIQLKQEADGWPSWVKNDSDKEKYIKDYEKHEGVQLNVAQINKNPGLRALAKLMLNSFWGKFGQRNNMCRTIYFTDALQYFKHIYEPGRIVHSINIVSENLVSVSSTFEDCLVDILPNTNAVIAAFTRAQARLKLYTYLEKLGDRVLYFDTDSIIYTTKLGTPNQYTVPLGSYLGCMTDELEKDYGNGSYIVEFISSGPKSYGYSVYSTNDKKIHYSVKCKGFALTSEISKIINFDCLKKLVFDFVENNATNLVQVNYQQIARTKDHTVVTKSSSKNYRVVYTKRVVKNDFSTIPFGFKTNLDILIDML